MTYILYSTPVQLRNIEVQVPPISMYYMRKLLELKDSGVNFDSPKADELGKIVALIGDIIRENHPDITNETLEKELDAINLKEVMTAIQGLPKNAIAQTGTQASQTLSPETEK